MTHNQNISNQNCLNLTSTFSVIINEFPGTDYLAH